MTDSPSFKRFLSSKSALILIVVLVALVVSFPLLSNLLEPKSVGWGIPVDGLKAIAGAQKKFHKADQDGDGKLEFGTLRELQAANLVDSVLGSGTRYGWLFECTYGASSAEFLWFATARPEGAGVKDSFGREVRGDAYFVVNDEGAVYYTTLAPISLDSRDCKIPAGAKPAW